MESSDAFVFPRAMPREVAQELLAESYSELDEGKLLRRTNKELRKRGVDPPMDVQYVAQPAVVEYDDGLGIAIGADILIYEVFPELDACRDAFEDVLGELLMERVEKKVGRWTKRQPKS